MWLVLTGDVIGFVGVVVARSGRHLRRIVDPQLIMVHLAVKEILNGGPHRRLLRVRLLVVGRLLTLLRSLVKLLQVERLVLLGGS